MSLNSFFFIVVLCFLSSCEKKSELDGDLILDYSGSDGSLEFECLKVYGEGDAIYYHHDSLFKGHVDVEGLVAIISRIKKKEELQIYSDESADSYSFLAIMYEGEKSASIYSNGVIEDSTISKFDSVVKLAIKGTSWKILKDTSVIFSSLNKLNVKPKIDSTTKFLPPE